MRKHLIRVSAIKHEGATESYKEESVAMNTAVKDRLIGFVVPLDHPTPTLPTLEDSNESSASESPLKWKDLNTRYNIPDHISTLHQYTTWNINFYLSKELYSAIVLGHVVC